MVTTSLTDPSTRTEVQTANGITSSAEVVTPSDKTNNNKDDQSKNMGLQASAPSDLPGKNYFLMVCLLDFLLHFHIENFDFFRGFLRWQL